MFFEDTFMKKNFSLSFLDDEQKIFVGKNSTLRVMRNFLMKFFLEKKCDFFFIFVYWTNFSVFVSKDFPQNCQNWILRVHRRPWKEYIFFEKTLAALIVFGSERKNFGLLAKLFGRVVQTAFDLSLGSFWEVFLKKNQIQLIILAHWANPFRHSVKIFLAGLLENTIWSFNHCQTLSKMFSFFCQKNCSSATKTAYCVFTGTVWTKKVLEKKSWVFLIFFRRLSKKILAPYRFFFDGVVKSVFDISMGTFRRKRISIILFRLSILFRTITGKKFGVPSSFFRQGWKNCILCLNR